MAVFVGRRSPDQVSPSSAAPPSPLGEPILSREPRGARQAKAKTAWTLMRRHYYAYIAEPKLAHSNPLSRSSHATATAAFHFPFR